MFSLALSSWSYPLVAAHWPTPPSPLPLATPEPSAPQGSPLSCWGGALVRVQRGREQVKGTPSLQPGEDFTHLPSTQGWSGVGPREDPRIIVIMVTIYGELALG